MNSTIMTPAHPQWTEFCNRLAGPGAYNFRGRGEKIRFTCGGGDDKTFARTILAEMGFGKWRINASCDYFEEHGGFCDCEILFNVET